MLTQGQDNTAEFLESSSVTPVILTGPECDVYFYMPGFMLVAQPWITESELAEFWYRWTHIDEPVAPEGRRFRFGMLHKRDGVYRLTSTIVI
ncbi:hypothetical protein [Corynebacterium auriscanis]|uniref:Uncharacterized protein n=1 Tax=Corynebacterium auriscanis TaxID=99807 RepID=A0A0A2DJN7_9CORY|nr:hypothetical protein [Corynebacterium auriscanis]KGM18129.1 hypothetical protein MA47_09495 [Corynebacterium auriscanis]WJY73191.1 hypothetical protein CAURIC_07880 [Corynebacterium auriscanis]